MRVDLELLSAEGISLAKNYHVLLIDDQVQAKARFRELNDQAEARSGTFGNSYYRYFPELLDLDNE